MSFVGLGSFAEYTGLEEQLVVSNSSHGSISSAGTNLPQLLQKERYTVPPLVVSVSGYVLSNFFGSLISTAELSRTGYVKNVGE